MVTTKIFLLFFSTFLAVFLTLQNTWAQTFGAVEMNFEVLPRSAKQGKAPISITEARTRTTRSKNTRVRLHLGCYMTNLRGVKNGMTTGSLITAHLLVRDSSSSNQEIQLQFPSWYAFHHECQEGSTAPGCIADSIQNSAKSTNTLVTTMESMVQFTAATPLANIADLATGAGKKKPIAKNNVIEFDLKNIYKPTTSITVHKMEEDDSLNDKNKVVTSIFFTQAANTTVGINMPASDGNLASNVRWHTSEDGGDIEVEADLPMASGPDRGPTRATAETRTGNCGEHYSPLMLFFDEARPKFSAVSDFPLHPDSGRLFWPEPNAPGYFLVLDKNHNGQIDSGDEMFGDQWNFSNGFEALAIYDVDKKGKRHSVIDKRSKIFKSLQLWQDKNSNGKVDPGELFSLSDLGVVSIDLKYRLETVLFGQRASYDQASTFKFKDKHGKIRTGAVLDIWLNQAEPSLSKLSSK